MVGKQPLISMVLRWFWCGKPLAAMVLQWFLVQQPLLPMVFQWFCSPATIAPDGFQWFSMVANHWSNDGMVTIHCYGLLKTFKDLSAPEQTCAAIWSLGANI